MIQSCSRRIRLGSGQWLRTAIARTCNAPPSPERHPGGARRSQWALNVPRDCGYNRWYLPRDFHHALLRINQLRHDP
jgi:hypothetical protein